MQVLSNCTTYTNNSVKELIERPEVESVFTLPRNPVIRLNCLHPVVNIVMSDNRIDWCFN